MKGDYLVRERSRVYLTFVKSNRSKYVDEVSSYKNFLSHSSLFFVSSS